MAVLVCCMREPLAKRARAFKVHEVLRSRAHTLSSCSLFVFIRFLSSRSLMWSHASPLHHRSSLSTQGGVLWWGPGEVWGEGSDGCDGGGGGGEAVDDRWNFRLQCHVDV